MTQMYKILIYYLPETNTLSCCKNKSRDLSYVYRSRTSGARMQKIDREIFNLTIPNVISNISLPLISSVDTALMGSLSSLHLTAVGLGSMLFGFLYWNMGFLRMSTTGVVAQAYGAKKMGETHDAFIRALLLGLLAAIIILIFRAPLFDFLSSVLNLNSDQEPMVQQYFQIRIFDAVPSLLLFVIMGWCFGMQNARIPMIVTICINLINVFLSAYLVIGQDMGIAGVAYGTLFAQYLGLLLILLLVYKTYGAVFVAQQKRIKVYVQHVGALLSVNRDIFLRTLLLSTVFLTIYKFSNSISAEIMAINIVFLQFANWTSYSLDGYAYALESLTGKYKGMGNAHELNKVIQRGMYWALLSAVGLSGIFYFFFEPIFMLFIQNSEIELLTQARNFKWWIILFPVIGFASYIWDGVYVGLIWSKEMFVSMLLAAIVYFSFYYSIGIHYYNNGIWLAFWLFLIVRAAGQWFWYSKYQKKA